MSDDAVGPDAEHPVGHLLVGRDPAPGISPPAELGEGCVEASREGGQHDLGIEVSDSLLRLLPPSSSSVARLTHGCTIYGLRLRKWIAMQALKVL